MPHGTDETGDALPEGDEPAGSNGDGNGSSPFATFFGFVVLIAIIAGVVWLIAQLAPDHVQEPKSPGFIDNIFASPIVVAAARLVLLSGSVVLLFGGLYIVASTLYRMKRQEWLRRAGWFESQVSEQVEAGLDQAEDVFNWWMEALGENERLSERLEESDQTIGRLLDEREALIQELKQRGET